MTTHARQFGLPVVIILLAGMLVYAVIAIHRDWASAKQAAKAADAAIERSRQETERLRILVGALREAVPQNKDHP